MPLGNALGPPDDADTQRKTVADALALVDSASEPTTVRANLHWSNNGSWKENYMRIDDPAALAQAGIDNREKRQAEIAAGLRRPPLKR